MVSSLARQLQERLEEAEVVVKLQHRGRDPRPGRTDSVIWLRPDNVPVNSPVPILVELEGAEDTTASYHASKEDVRQFAARHDPSDRPVNDEFRYHLGCPVLDRGLIDAIGGGLSTTVASSTPAPVTLPIDYKLFTVPSTTMVGTRAATDADLHRALWRQFGEAARRRKTPKCFSSTAVVDTRGPVEYVGWIVKWSLPNANEGTVTMPFVVNAAPPTQTLLEEAFATLTIPVMVVLDGSPPTKAETVTHQTGIRFQTVTPASITQDWNDDAMNANNGSSMELAPSSPTKRGVTESSSGDDSTND